ncbi:SDR family NAD(P)-dependent oxidoreductase [Ancrocorticia populi]|uniref:Oxidoreductase n=1 Tax=Ancrocorticia populi TaxID=2175228 RepID=A0A2V1K3R4_9ACTO|nr:SDR family oxidoreductase [Ancrocorticia populi]PWF25711.1 oxidoreductase [Ancrocorticia populi]
MARIVVTGASTGIGEATVRRLTAEGYEVIATARREARLTSLSEQTGCSHFAADLTKQEDIDALVAFLGDGPVAGLVNVAGGALGQDPVAEGKVTDWQRMYEINVIATLRLTQALLPQFREKGGDLVFLTSTAAHETYPGGAGYTAAKHAERMIANTLRIELVGEPVRIVEIAPGMVKTEEFSKNRLGGEAAAEKVYQGVAEPLVAEDIADIIFWTLSRPKHVNIDLVQVRPVAQANSWTVAREPDAAPAKIPRTALDSIK